MRRWSLLLPLILLCFVLSAASANSFLRRPRRVSKRANDDFRRLPVEVSHKIVNIPGLPTSVWGLDELRPKTRNVAVLWLLHGRGDSRQSMAGLASAAIKKWEARQPLGLKHSKRLGLIAVCFDQRNHGARETHAPANNAWVQGNEGHAKDMYTVYHGTALDTSQMIRELGMHLFPMREHRLVRHIALGISLGGHSTWQLLLRDPKVSAGVVVVGTPDYARLMAHRAETSQRSDWVKARGKNPVPRFFPSKDFPLDLMHRLVKEDPAGVLLGSARHRVDLKEYQPPTEQEKKRMVPLLKDHLHGKHILSLSGGVDTLVPYSASRPFLHWLKNAVQPGGWGEEAKIHFQDKVYDGMGHGMNTEMVQDAMHWIIEVLHHDESGH